MAYWFSLAPASPALLVIGLESLPSGVGVPEGLRMSIRKIATYTYYNHRFTLLYALMLAAFLTAYVLMRSSKAPDKRDQARVLQALRAPPPGSPTDTRLFRFHDPQIHKEFSPDYNNELSPDYAVEGKEVRVPLRFSQQQKCPACYGDGQCEEMNRDIKVHMPPIKTHAQDKGVLYAKWEDKFVALKKLQHQSKYDKYDEFLCKNVSYPDDCDVAEAIMDQRSYILTNEAFKPRNLMNAWQIVHSRPDELPLTACMNNDLVDELAASLSGAEKLDELSDKQRAMLYTSIVINPEAIILRFFNRLQSARMWHHFPIYLGSCGRSIIEQHAGLPLRRFVNAEPGPRIDIAMQTLAAAMRLLNVTSRWSMYHADLHFDNFFVSKEGQVYIIDVRDVGIIDNHAYPPSDAYKDKVCNEECWKTWSVRLFDPDDRLHSYTCSVFPTVATHAMYASICKNILYEPTEETGPRRHSKTRKNRIGLLHSMKGVMLDSEEALLDKALRDCINEPVPGARMLAVENIMEILIRYAHPNQNGFADYYEIENEEDYEDDDEDENENELHNDL